jgi:hypothetical protein
MNMKTRYIAAISLVPLLVAGALLSARPQAGLMVVTWGGNSPEWNRILHVSAVRIGCSDAPASCIRQVDQMAASQQVSSVFLGVLLNPANAATNAATFGNLALSHPNLAEVGFDDFVSQCEKTHLGPSDLSTLIQTFSSNLKSRSAKVQFGATIYQDQLITGELDKLQLSDAARGSVDIVHLFPHYRKERKSVTDYVAEAKRVFPNAKIILGVYAYDRREYLPCEAGSHTACSSDEEVNLFDQVFHEDLRIASGGGVVGIEFFPGNFGAEDSWKGWNNSRACREGERAVCVQNTIAMRDRVRQAMNDAAL